MGSMREAKSGSLIEMFGREKEGGMDPRDGLQEAFGVSQAALA